MCMQELMEQKQPFPPTLIPFSSMENLHCAFQYICCNCGNCFINLHFCNISILAIRNFTGTVHSKVWNWSCHCHSFIQKCMYSFIDLQKYFILTDYIFLSITNYLFKQIINLSIQFLTPDSIMLHSYDYDLLVCFSSWTNFNVKMQKLMRAETKK